MEPTELAEQKGQVNVTLPVGIVILLLTWAASSLITYGIVSTRIEWLSQRVDTVERQMQTYVPRTEYDSSRSDIVSRLDRIERKLDQLR